MKINGVPKIHQFLIAKIFSKTFMRHERKKKEDNFGRRGKGNNDEKEDNF